MIQLRILQITKPQLCASWKLMWNIFQSILISTLNILINGILRFNWDEMNEKIPEKLSALDLIAIGRDSRIEIVF